VGAIAVTREEFPEEVGPQAPPGDGSTQGDPHFKIVPFHGECDLMLLRSKDFESGVDLDVRIRTKMLRDMSFISSAFSVFDWMFLKSRVRESTISTVWQMRS
jgi:hypothetical protein